MAEDLKTRVARTIVPHGSVGLFWLGQAGFVLKTSDQKVIYIDPYLSNCVERIEGLVRMVPAPIKPSEVQADLILLSHDHIDHLDPDIIQELSKASRAPIIGPRSCARHMADLGVDPTQIIELNTGHVVEVKGIRIAATPAEAGDFEPGFGVGYLIKSMGITTYFTGDTSYLPQLEELRITLPDIFITCINGNMKYGNLYIRDVVKLTEILKPKYVIPMHYGMFKENTADPDRFLKELNDANVNVKPIIFKHGEGKIISIIN